MEWLKSLYTYTKSLESRRLYQYMAFILVGIMLMVVGMLYIRYSYIEEALSRIASINEDREKIKRIITSAEKVKKQRASVNAMLTQDESFKISSYLDTILKKLNLLNKTTIDGHSQVDLENGYRESIRKINLVGMNMKEVAELLQEIEKNERVYTKELEIVRSSQDPKTIDVMLAVATLEPRTGASS